MSITESGSAPASRLPRVSRLWLGLAVTSVFLVVSVLLAYRAVDAERVAVSREAESVRLGDELSEASDLLTDEVRKFVVTADPVHLQSYWYEIETRRTRERVLSRLDALGTPAEELRLLESAKNQSDELVATEIRGMRLMLTVMGVPEASMPVSVRNYRLLAADAKLPPAEMVALAQRIMFDKTYSNAKRRIMEPVEAFRHALHERVTRETTAARQRTNSVLGALAASVAATALLVLLFVWRRLLEVKEASSHDPEST